MSTDTIGANATQVGGTHYKGVSYQHWDLAWDMHLEHFPAAISKYGTRHGKKNGREDVEKAIHYAEKYLEVIAGVECPFPRLFEDYTPDGYLARREYNPRVTAYANMVWQRYVEANQLRLEEASLIGLIVHPHDGAGVRKMLELLQAILQRDYPPKKAARYQPDDEGDSAAEAGPGYVAQGHESFFERPDHHNPGEGVPAG